MLERRTQYHTRNSTPCLSHQALTAQHLVPKWRKWGEALQWMQASQVRWAIQPDLSLLNPDAQTSHLWGRIPTLLTYYKRFPSKRIWKKRSVGILLVFSKLGWISFSVCSILYLGSRQPPEHRVESTGSIGVMVFGLIWHVRTDVTVVLVSSHNPYLSEQLGATTFFLRFPDLHDLNTITVWDSMFFPSFNRICLMGHLRLH